MGFDFATAEEIQAMIDKGISDEALLRVYEHLLEMINDGYAVFHDKETGKWSAAEPGKPLPPHIQKNLLNKKC